MKNQNDSSSIPFPIKDRQEIKLEIHDFNHSGEGVGRLQGFTIFVPGAVPGDVVKARAVSIKKTYARASLLSILTPSPHRVTPPCPYFTTCGGCQLQHVSYQKQLEWKHNKVKSDLRRLGGINIPVHPPSGMNNPYRYRNKAGVSINIQQYSAKAGFCQQGSNRLVDIEDCLIQHPSNVKTVNMVRRTLNELLPNYSNKIRKTLSGIVSRASFLENNVILVLEITEEVEKNKDWLNMLADKILSAAGNSVTGIIAAYKGKRNEYTTIRGDSHLLEISGGFYFRLSPHSFFQVNSNQAEILYETALRYAGVPHTAFDLFCGTGTMAHYLGKVSSKVFGLDSEQAAINDAIYNARLNGQEHIHFYRGKAEKKVDLLLKGNRPATVVVDPPRGGCNPELLKAIAAAGPEHLVYISCNPATLARDLSYLQKIHYTPIETQPVDMFPHTSHIETVTGLAPSKK